MDRILLLLLLLSFHASVRNPSALQSATNSEIDFKIPSPRATRRERLNFLRRVATRALYMLYITKLFSTYTRGVSTRYADVILKNQPVCSEWIWRYIGRERERDSLYEIFKSSAQIAIGQAIYVYITYIVGFANRAHFSSVAPSHPLSLISRLCT